jgi:hypothetical protein
MNTVIRFIYVYFLSLPWNWAEVCVLPREGRVLEPGGGHQLTHAAAPSHAPLQQARKFTSQNHATSSN